MTGARPSEATVAALTQQGLIEAVCHAGSVARRIRATGNGRFILNEIVLRLALSFTYTPARHALTSLPPAAE
jgi:oxygen-independent coproporphyrinogen-3 oxidase